MPEPARKVFIIGEHGQLARALQQAYAARGEEARLAGRRSVDIADRAGLIEAIATVRPDLIVNAAAYTAVDRAEDDADSAFRINRDGAAHAAAAAAGLGVPLIQISTDYVFDGAKPSSYVETDVPNPLGVYGASKLAGERAVSEAGCDHVILRTGWLYGPGGSNFLETMLRLARQRGDVRVVDDQRGAPTLTSDLARAIVAVGDAMLAAADRAALCGIYHATGSGETTWCGFARSIMAISARHGGPSCPIRAIATADYPTQARRPANSRLDGAKLAGTFGLRLPAWQDSLEACFGEIAVRMERVPT
jgi:dTDP-4-dehydrorhamnose reductase